VAPAAPMSVALSVVKVNGPLVSMGPPKCPMSVAPTPKKLYLFVMPEKVAKSST